LAGRLDVGGEKPRSFGRSPRPAASGPPDVRIADGMEADPWNSPPLVVAQLIELFTELRFSQGHGRCLLLAEGGRAKLSVKSVLRRSRSGHYCWSGGEDFLWGPGTPFPTSRREQRAGPILTWVSAQEAVAATVGSDSSGRAGPGPGHVHEHRRSRRARPGSEAGSGERPLPP